MLILKAMSFLEGHKSDTRGTCSITRFQDSDFQLQFI
jgi:hypothetical protein